TFTHLPPPLLTAIQIYIMDRCRNVISNGFEDHTVILCKCVDFVGLNIQDTDHLIIVRQRYAKFRACVLGREGRGTVTFIFFYAGCQDRFAFPRDPGDDSLGIVEGKGIVTRTYVSFAATCHKSDQTSIQMDGEQIDMWIAKAVMDQCGN